MKKADSPRGLLNQELKAVEWSQQDTLAVLRASADGGHRSMKATTKLALTLMLALILMGTTALAATLLFSPRYDALQLADQALLETYGITDTMQTALHHTIVEAEDAIIVTYEMTEQTVMRENRFGVYTVTVQGGKVEASWSMDGLETAGGLDAPAWGAEQLLMYVQDYSRVSGYMESHGMYQNAPVVTPAPEGVPDKWEQDKQTALSLAKITLDEADAIGREAVTARYGLTAQQAAMLLRFTDMETDGTADESTYEIRGGRPLVNLFFHLTQHPGAWAEKDGTYVVTINLLDGAVEDISYDNGRMGNG